MSIAFKATKLFCRIPLQKIVGFSPEKTDAFTSTTKVQFQQCEVPLEFFSNASAQRMLKRQLAANLFLIDNS